LVDFPLEGFTIKIGVLRLGLPIELDLDSASVNALGTEIRAGLLRADPISAWFNNELKLKLKPASHKRFVGVAMLILGFVTVLKTAGVI